MKILKSYKKIAKSMLTEHAWDRKFGEPLVTLEDVMKEAESMKLQPKGGGKTVIFKDKDNYEKAKKSGDYEDPKGLGDDDKEEPSGKLGGGDFEREPDDSEFGYEDDEEAQAQAEKDMEDEFGDMDMEEESISINGKKYREVKEYAWDRKFGEPLPTLADVMKVKEENNSLKEKYKDTEPMTLLMMPQEYSLPRA